MALMFGCGSGSDEPDLVVEPVEDELNLYSSTLDRYLKVSPEGNVQYLKCTINDGYVPVEEITGVYSNNKLTLNYYGQELISTLLESSEGGYKEFTNSSIFNYEIVEAIPSYCDNDSVEVTSFYPENAVAGVESEFIINIDYRLVSKDSAIIYPKFDTAALNKFSFNYEKIDITSGTKSASFSAWMTPINGEDIQSLVTLRMMGLVEGSSSTYYDLADDKLKMAISAPESPIISESIVGKWATECIELYSMLDDSNSRKYTYEISDDEIVWSYDLYTDSSCVDYIKTNSSNFSYSENGIVTAIEGIQVRQLEKRFVSGGYIGDPEEDFFFAYNDVLFGLWRDETTDEIEAAFIDPYFLVK